MSSDPSIRARTLRRIADALGQPVEALVVANYEISGEAYPSAAETHALLAAFVKLTSPQARRRIINAAEAETRRAAAP